ncbi:MAG: OsmC family peroxiredoxin [Saprospiraceae bacterium]|nr:OsmC family peroxiredoxin [Saprospiraceae bacterium]
MKRTAKAHWEGTLKEGKGHLTTQSGILNEQNYSYKTRFEEGVAGTNPEELLLAAHVGCFTMAVGAALTQQGLQPESLDTEGALTLESGNITGIHLSITGKVAGISAADFETIVKEKEANCIVSRALSVPITSEAKLL